MGESSNPYTLKQPCKNCPFRTDVDPFITQERARDIASSLQRDEWFACHKTVDYEEDQEGFSEGVVGSRARACAGALIVMEKQGFSNGAARMAERLGMFKPETLDMDSPVYGSLAEWVAAHGTTPTVVDSDGTVLEYEHCGVVGDDCEDPAGYSMGGGVSSNMDEPTCNPLTDTCSCCGSTCCAACTATVETEEVGGKSFTVKTCLFCANGGDGDDED